MATARNVALTPGKILLGGCRNQPRPFDYSDWVPLILRPLEQQLRQLGDVGGDFFGGRFAQGGRFLTPLHPADVQRLELRCCPKSELIVLISLFACPNFAEMKS
jgi:hypothetical protein